MKSLRNKKNRVLTGFERQLCSVQGKMFEISVKRNFSSREFIDSYMNGKTAYYFDLPYDRTQWLGEENLFQDVLDEGKSLPKGKTYPLDSVYWIGYIYRYWHFLTGQSSKEISAICNAQLANALYPAYHTLDCTAAIERIIESHQEKINLPQM